MLLLDYLENQVYYKSCHLRQSGLFFRSLPRSLFTSSFRDVQVLIERPSILAWHIISSDIGLAMSCCKDRMNGFGREFNRHIYLMSGPTLTTLRLGLPDT